ncbi:hypothetical protein [uncultured Sphingomonas sp.]|uniref:hypothetical protein n=1 Tax=uncultured Sphingomonas sp. TaxID=158754 RepID=UPI0035C9FAB4
MILIHDRASAARALEHDLEPHIRAALERELALLTSGPFELTDHTDILLVQPGDGEGDIEREAGVSPLVGPIDGVRWDQPGFELCWDLLTLGGGVFRAVFTFGGTHAVILLVPDALGVLPELLDCLRRYAAA